METKVLNTYKVTYEKDIVVSSFKEEIHVVASNFNEAVEKVNAILSEYGRYTIYSIEYVGECYL